MEVIRNKLKRLSQVVYVFAKIAFVASIVGVVLSVATIVWGIVAGDPLAPLTIGGSDVYFAAMSGEPNLAVAYGTIAYTLAACCFMIAIMRILMRLFANMRDDYTPFTMENADLLNRAAIQMIVAAIVPMIVGEGVGMTLAKIYALPFNADFADGFSLVVVLVFFAMAQVFRYGCALQEQADTTL